MPIDLRGTPHTADTTFRDFADAIDMLEAAMASAPAAHRPLSLP